MEYVVTGIDVGIRELAVISLSMQDAAPYPITIKRWIVHDFGYGLKLETVIGKLVPFVMANSWMCTCNELVIEKQIGKRVVMASLSYCIATAVIAYCMSSGLPVPRISYFGSLTKFSHFTKVDPDVVLPLQYEKGMSPYERRKITKGNSVYLTGHLLKTIRNDNPANALIEKQFNETPMKYRDDMADCAGLAFMVLDRHKKSRKRPMPRQNRTEAVLVNTTRI